MSTRRNLSKFTYETLKELVPILIFIITSGFVLGGLWNHVSAYDGRIKDLEDWRVRQAEDMATVKQYVKDIHDFLLPERSR